MYTLRLGLLTFLVCFTTITWAQSAKYKTMGRKCVRVEIADAGELYSTYTLTDTEIQSLLDKKIKRELIDDIQAYGNETGWPAKLKLFDERIANPDQIKKYVVYEVAKVNDMHILVIPAKYNSNLPDGWAVSRDIYLLMNDPGVKK